jgi:hypothetical protein
MKFFHQTPSGERGGLRAAALLWILGLPLAGALVIGYLFC